MCTEQSGSIVIDSEDVKVSCNTNNVGYRWLCVICKDRNINKVYEGETGRSAWIQEAEHLDDFRKQQEKVYF